MVEMYRRGAWRDDLLHERCAEVIGIDARLAEIDELLHGSEGTRAASAARRSCAARTSARTAAGCSTRARSTTRCSTTPSIDAAVGDARSSLERCADAAARPRSPSRRRARAAAPPASPSRTTASSAACACPVAVGTVASLRRGWVRQDRLVPGRLGLARARRARRRRRRRGRRDRARPEARRGRRPVTVVAPALADLAPDRRRPGATAAPAGREGLDGWTVVLVSSPATRGQTKPLALATRRRAGAACPQVGVLDSSALREPPPGLLRRLQRRLRSARQTPERRSKRCAPAASAAPTCSESRRNTAGLATLRSFHLLPKKKSFVTCLRTR